MDLPPLDSLWNFGDPAASERRFADRIAVIAAEPPEVRAEAMTQLARSQGLQRRFADAHATLDAAEPLAGVGRARVRLLLERGRVFNSSGSPAEARPFFEAAWELARASREDGLAVDAAHMLGILGPDGLAWNERAVALAQSSDQPAARRWLGSLYNNIAWTYHDAGRFEEALAVFRAALEEREQAGARGPLLVARWAVARALRSLGRFEEAAAIQSALLEEHERDGSTDGFVHEELAENLLSLGRPNEARPHFARAHELLAADLQLAEREPLRLQRLASLAQPPEAG
jgi:tetratricopeptide (TPR) repeat protein